MRMMKLVAMMVAAMAAMVVSAGDSTPFNLDTYVDPTVESSVSVSWDASWIGGNSGATVVIADNGDEVKSATGMGEFLYGSPVIGRHELTYTTYIDGIAQEEFYSVVVFTTALGCSHVTTDANAHVATCTETGYTGDLVCQICGVVVERGATIPALGHEAVETKVAKEATCTESGWMHEVWCSRCNEILEASSSIEALGHYMGEGIVTKPPTTSEDGVVTYCCTRCGIAMKTEVVPKIVIGWAIDADGVLTGVNLNGATEVTIPDTVKSIGDRAFCNCRDLTDVTIQNSVTNIGDWAFSGCIALRKLDIPFGVSRIGKCAFMGCSGLEELRIPGGMVIVENDAFSGCDGIRSVILPLDTLRCGLVQSKFDVYNDWKSSVVDSPTRANVSGVLMGYAYDETTAAKTFSDPIYGGSYTWNATNTTFGYYGHMYMEAGREYVFGKYFDNSARLVIDGVEVLSNSKYADFATGKYLPNVTGWHELEVRLADGTGEKGPRGGSTGTHPWNVDIGVGWRDDGVTNAVPESAWNKLMDPGDGSLFRVEMTLQDLLPDSYAKVTNITFDANFSRVMPAHFLAGCKSLTSVTVPQSVLRIGEGAFAGCSSLTNMVLPFIGAARQSDLPIYTPQSSFGYIFGTSKYSGCVETTQEWTNKTSVTYYIPSSLASVAITDETETGYRAFGNCKNIVRILLNEGVQRIRGSSFSNCTSLRDVYIPKTTTMIVGTSFLGCTSLLSVTIPKSVIQIEQKAFASDANLTTVVFEGNAPEMGNSVFSGVASSCTAYVSRESTGWGVAIPGTWNGIHIEYFSIEPLCADAAPSVVTNAIEAAGFADAAGVKAAIGGSAEKYMAFKSWAQGVKHPVRTASAAIAAGEGAVIANTNAAVAFMLGAERLFEKAPKIEFGEVGVFGCGEGMEELEGAKRAITLTVTVRDGEDAVKCVAEKVKKMFEATGDLGDWNGAVKLVPTVSIEDGDGETMRFNVTPGDGTASKAFLRIKVK